MNFDWYKLFNLTEFMATGLVSRKLTVILGTLGQRDILICRGNEVSMIYADVLMPIDFESDNPFIREGDDAHYAVFKDENLDVWLGIEAEA